MCGTIQRTVAHSSAAATGLYARIRVRPARECILRRLSEQHTVHEYMPGTPGESRPQVVVKPNSDAADLLDADEIEEIIWLGDRAVCLLRHFETASAKQAMASESQSTASREDHHCGMVLYGFGRLPVPPVAVRLSDGWLELHLVTAVYPKLRETISELREAAFDVDLRQVVQSDRASPPQRDEFSTLSVVDLSGLTERQREVATVAVEMGYFQEAGATAGETAAALGISKSTLSEHIRIVIRKLISQIIP